MRTGGRAPRTWDRVRALLALGTVFGLGAVGTLAAWTDESRATSGTFSTGTVRLRLASPGSGGAGATTFAFSTFSATNLKPGSSTDASLEVRNTGSLPFTYTLSSSTVGGSSTTLGPGVDLVVAAGSCTGSAVSATGSSLSDVTLTGPRALAAGASETLCFRASLAAAAPSALQGQSGSYTYVFTAANS